MWFVTFVLGSAVAVTILVLGASAYVDHRIASVPQMTEVVPIPRAAPRPKVRPTALVEDEVVREPEARKGARHWKRDSGRRGTW
jgi:hypothetical protein